jgi:KDO2-lipid IV(A) lauroyltransferase
MLSFVCAAWTAPLHAAVGLLLRVLLAAASILPRCWLAPISRVIGDVAYYVVPRRRRIALRNLEIAFGDTIPVAEKRRVGRESFRNLVANVLILGARTRHVTASRLPELFECSPADDALLTELAAAPFAILASHVGDWEISHHYLALRGMPLQVVVRQLSNPYLDRKLNDLRSMHGAGVIPKHGALRSLLRILRDGRPVGLLADQNCPTRERFFPFFGVPASTYTEHARLLAKAGCRVAFFACLRVDGGLQFRLVVRDLTANLAPLTSTKDRDAIRERADTIISRYLEVTEEVVREHPGQYLWLHRRWKSRPDDTPWLYHDLHRPLPPATRQAAIDSFTKG